MSSNSMGMVIQCRAAVAWKRGEPLSLETVEVAPPRAGEVRIRVFATGICRTELSALDGYMEKMIQNFPCILGHEGAGIVESVGQGVTSVQPGDHVIPLNIPQCSQCKVCQTPGANMCMKDKRTMLQGVMPDKTTRFTCKGQVIYHFLGCSTFSQWTVVTESAVCKVNCKASMDKICLLGCGISTGYGAALNTATIKPNSTVAIWGLGTVGLAVVMGAKRAGAGRIIGLDINPKKFPLALQLGATEVYDPSQVQEPVDQFLKRSTDGGVDTAFECIGNIRTMRQAFESCNKNWGETVILGLDNMSLELSIDPVQLLQGCSLKGSSFGGWKGKDDMPRLVEEYLSGIIPIDDFVTRTFPLDDVNAALTYLQSGDGISVVIQL